MSAVGMPPGCEPAAEPLVVDFARELGTNVIKLYRLIARGLISARRERIGRRHYLRIVREDAERIRARLRREH
jgi:hypothetical protein